MAYYAVYNGFWNERPSEPVVALAAAARQQGLTLTPRKNTDCPVMLTATGVTVPGFAAGDRVLFWDKDVRLARALEATGVRVYNPAAAIERCDDKAATHLCLSRQGIPQPRTLVAPMTYRDVTFPAAETLVQAALQAFSFPMIVKECYGSFGQQVFLADSEPALRRLVAERAERPFLIQEAVTGSFGRDHRLYVVNGQVIAAMERRSDTDFRANIGGGGTGTAYTPTDEERALAERCCRVLGLRFGGVDLLDGPTGPLVCEVNSNAYFAALTACTGVDVAAALIGMLKEDRT